MVSNRLIPATDTLHNQCMLNFVVRNNKMNITKIHIVHQFNTKIKKFQCHHWVPLISPRKFSISSQLNQLDPLPQCWPEFFSSPSSWFESASSHLLLPFLLPFVFLLPFDRLYLLFFFYLLIIFTFCFSQSLSAKRHCSDFAIFLYFFFSFYLFVHTYCFFEKCNFHGFEVTVFYFICRVFISNQVVFIATLAERSIGLQRNHD